MAVWQDDRGAWPVVVGGGGVEGEGLAGGDDDAGLRSVEGSEGGGGGARDELGEAGGGL